MWNKRSMGGMPSMPKMGQPKPMGQPAVPPMPPPPSMTPQMGALSSMGSSAPAPLPTGGTHPTDVIGIRDLTQLPTNPYKMAGIGRIDKFPRLFKNTKV